MVRPHGGTTLAGLVRSLGDLQLPQQLVCRSSWSAKSRRFAAATAAGLPHPQQRQRLVADLRRGLGLPFAATEFARLGDAARLVLEARTATLARPTWLAKVVFSGLRRAAGGLLARRRGLGAGRGGHQEPNRKIRSEVPLALALRATARNRCGPTGCLAACWLVGPADLNSGLATLYLDLSRY